MKAVAGAPSWRCPRCGAKDLAAAAGSNRLCCRSCPATFAIVDEVPCFAPGPYQLALQADLEEMAGFVDVVIERRTAWSPADPGCFRLPDRHVRSVLAQEQVEIPWLARTLGPLAGQRILNVSCGLGRDADILVRHLGACRIPVRLRHRGHFRGLSKRSSTFGD